MRTKRRVAISTGGGDAPDLNAAIRSAVLTGLSRGWEMVGIERGFDGLFVAGNVVLHGRAGVAGIT